MNYENEDHLFGKNEDHFKHSVKIRIIRNKYYKNENDNGI